MSKVKYINLDMRNAIQTAVDEAVQDTTEKTNTTIAKKLIASGLDDQLIAEATGLPPEVIRRLRSEMA